MRLASLITFSCGIYLSFGFIERVEDASYKKLRVHSLWETFKSIHSRVFANFSSERQHFRLFSRRFRLVEHHEKLYNAGQVSFRIEVNEFADQVNSKNHVLQSFAEPAYVNVFQFAQDRSPLPESIDWRTKGAVTSVKAQGHCGSCYAFAAVGALEGQNAIKHGKRIELSVQNLLDCSTGYGNFGCNGGYATRAYEYVQDYGLDSEKAYPYVAQCNFTCRFAPKEVEIRIDGFQELPRGDEEALQRAVATVGPISVAVNANLDTFNLYKSGVYYDRNCSGEVWDVSHMVLVVGYGTDASQGAYWILKNSYGANWGEQGYMRLARNKKNQCGIATMASFPVVNS